MTTAIRRITKDLVAKSGWLTGSELEDRVAWKLHRWGFVPNDTPRERRAGHVHNTAWDEVAQQYRIGRYRLDFAWKHLQVGLEVDGIYHRHPTTALRDAERDSWLRSQGWLMFRIDDSHADLDDQLLRFVVTLRSLPNKNDEHWFSSRKSLRTQD